MYIYEKDDSEILAVKITSIIDSELCNVNFQIKSNNEFTLNKLNSCVICRLEFLLSYFVNEKLIEHFWTFIKL